MHMSLRNLVVRSFMFIINHVSWVYQKQYISTEYLNISGLYVCMCAYTQSLFSWVFVNIVVDAAAAALVVVVLVIAVVR